MTRIRFMTMALTSSFLLALTLSVQPAAATGTCNAPIGGGSTTCGFCNPGERLTIVVTGLAASGSVSGCGVSASCSTGLSLSCTAVSPVATAQGALFTCSVSLGLATCTSA